MKEMTYAMRFFNKYAEERLDLFDVIFDIEKVQRAYEVSLQKGSVNKARYFYALLNNFYLDERRNREGCKDCKAEGIISSRGTYVLCDCQKNSRICFVNKSSVDESRVDYLKNKAKEKNEIEYIEIKRGMQEEKRVLRLDNFHNAYHFCKSKNDYQCRLAEEKSKGFLSYYFQYCGAEIRIAEQVIRGKLPIYLLGTLTNTKSYGIYSALKTSSRKRKEWIYNKPNNLDIHIRAWEQIDEDLEDISDLLYKYITEKKIS